MVFIQTLTKIAHAVDYIISRYCLARHKYDVESRDCWECGYWCGQHPRRKK